MAASPPPTRSRPSAPLQTAKAEAYISASSTTDRPREARSLIPLQGRILQSRGRFRCSGKERRPNLAHVHTEAEQVLGAAHIPLPDRSRPASRPHPTRPRNGFGEKPEPPLGQARQCGADWSIRADDYVTYSVRSTPPSCSISIHFICSFADNYRFEPFLRARCMLLHATLSAPRE